MHFGLLLLAGLLTASLPLPWQAGSLVFVMTALVVGVRALLSVWRAGLRGVLIGMLATGLAFTAVMSLVLVTLLALWPVQLARQRCMEGALTISATDTCQRDWTNDINQRREELKAPRTGA